jgi:hypothetical protein
MQRTPSHNWTQRPVKFGGADEFSDTLILPGCRLGIRYHGRSPIQALALGRIVLFVAAFIALAQAVSE